MGGGWEIKKKGSNTRWKTGWNVQRGRMVAGGRLEERKKGYCSNGWGMVGVGGLRAHPPGTASWNKQTAVRQTALFLMGEKLAAPWMFPCTFHFLNAVLSVRHLTRQQCLRTKTRFICRCT